MPARLNELTVVFVSIVLQSLPFLLLGVFASALVQRHLSEAWLARWLPRRALRLVLVSSLFGFVAPVCDCGVLPLARRLAAKGVPVYATTTFILAAPVVNPVVLLATAFAFQGNWGIVGLRMAMTLSVAIAVGLIASALFAPAAPPAPLPISGGQDLAAGKPPGLIPRATAEFFDVIFFVILGALSTAATQTLVPRAELLSLGGRPIASVLALMPVATLLSICSEADAFVARAFSTTFSLGAILAFMTIGQIVDLRNGVLLLRTVGPGLLGLIVVVSYVIVFAEAVAVNALVGRP
ncbi:MAG: permease [Candidatus Rokubacteria bacterium]|nr:permease [Candidatus Rokubacteria bacterium]